MKKWYIIVPPATKSLLTTDNHDSLWPAEIRSNPTIIAQAKMRRNLFVKLDMIFKQIPCPTMEMSKAIDSGKVAWQTAAEAYKLLTDFLQADPDHHRLILYLPFELLPSKTWQPASTVLALAIKRFTACYFQCWHNLLKEYDVRANFSDGNILEPELSPHGQIMVCKAAHLIPQLVQRGLISTESILNIMNLTPSKILRNSIADVLPVLEGRKEEVRPIPAQENDADWLARFKTEAEFELQKIKMREALDRSRGRPQPRIAWERQEKEKALIEKYADEVAAGINKDLLFAKTINDFLASGLDKIPTLSVINGIRKAIEFTFQNTPDKAQEIFSSFEEKISQLWLQDLPDTKDELISMLSRLENLGLIKAGYLLEKFNFSPPQLDSLALEAEEILKEEIRDLAPKLELLVTDADISKFIYPVVIFFGSRLKGYAKLNADLDAAVFIRPHTPKSKRPKIKRILSKMFSHPKIDKKVVEFWLTEKDGQLQIQDLPETDVQLADKTWAHILFAGIWLGEKNAIEELYGKLLPGFLYSQRNKFEDRNARSLWLEEMEREVLQYRLMHKGYKRYYPEQDGPHQQYPLALDPQSSFWDSGYRRLAAKLFISKVFLPQLEKKTKNKRQYP